MENTAIIEIEKSIQEAKNLEREKSRNELADRLGIPVESFNVLDEFTKIIAIAKEEAFIEGIKTFLPQIMLYYITLIEEVHGKPLEREFIQTKCAQIPLNDEWVQILPKRVPYLSKKLRESLLNKTFGNLVIENKK